MSGTQYTQFQVPASPGVNITETDLSTVVLQTAATPAAIAGLFRWGPVNEVTAVDANTYVKMFQTPTNYNAETFFCGSDYLSYSNSLYVTRVIANDVFSAVSTSANANVTSNATTTFLNRDDYISKVGAGGLTTNTSIFWAAKYPGALGNSLEISVCDSVDGYSQNVWSVLTTDGANTTNVTFSFAAGSNTTNAVFNSANDANSFASLVAAGDVVRVGNSQIGYQNLNVANVTTTNANVAVTFSENFYLTDSYTTNAASAANATSYFWRYWEYASDFAGAPGTTSYVASKGGSGDALHVVITDTTGDISGTPGKVLERFPNLSRATDAVSPNGQNNYYAEVINQLSQYVWWVNDRQAAYSNTANNITPLTTGVYYGKFQAGTDGASTEANVAPSVLMNGYGAYVNNEQIQPSMYISGKPIGGAANTLLANYIINNVAEVRKDAVVTVSPDYSYVVGNQGNQAMSIINNTLAYIARSSYGFLDSGYKYRYDQYNNVYRYTPLNGDTAGLMARTDKTNNVWWSPAGYKRGGIKNIVKLAYNPNKPDRDLLYPAGCNPVISQPGYGTVLFGDETLLGDHGSAFISIGVRRLFIAMEVALATATKGLLFEFNDPDTRMLFRNMVNPYLRDIEAQRGIVKFMVICDSTNNPDSVVQSRGFVGDIFILPNRSIDWIQLNFYAVGSSATFQEIQGSSPPTG